MNHYVAWSFLACAGMLLLVILWLRALAVRIHKLETIDPPLPPPHRDLDDLVYTAILVGLMDHGSRRATTNDAKAAKEQVLLALRKRHPGRYD